jgi:hypothetical protein
VMKFLLANRSAGNAPVFRPGAGGHANDPESCPRHSGGARVDR